MAYNLIVIPHYLNFKGYNMTAHRELEPRISVLEKGQEALQKDIAALGMVVKEQGTQITDALVKMMEKINEEKSQRISSSKTDWATILTGIGVGITAIVLISTPIWMQFNTIDRYLLRFEKEFDTIKVEQKLMNENFYKIKYSDETK